MYRVIDAARLWAVLGDHDFWRGPTLRMRLDLTDTFFPENAGVISPNVSEGGRRWAAAHFDVRWAWTLLTSRLLSLGPLVSERLPGPTAGSISDAGMANVVNRFLPPAADRGV